MRNRRMASPMASKYAKDQTNDWLSIVGVAFLVGAFIGGMTGSIITLMVAL